jgi:hypothetical protein
MSEPPRGENGERGRGPDPGPGGAGSYALAPPEITELVDACRQYVQRAVGVELDLTPETLPVLDHYVRLSRQHLEQRPELRALMARVVGGYFGEVARRHLGLFWHVPSADMHEWQLYGRSVLLAISPIGVAYDALHGSGEHDGPASSLCLTPEDRELVDRRLASLPPVPEDEYYLLSTRLEVVEIAADALRAQMLQDGTADVEFEASDYESEAFWLR